jgi:hypothetical protein
MIISRPTTVLATESNNGPDGKNNDAGNKDIKPNNEEKPVTKDETKRDTTSSSTSDQIPIIPPPDINKCDKGSIDASCKNPPQIITPPLVPSIDCNKTPNDPACESKSLPKCDGSFQDCVTRNGDICKAGQGGHECECAADMSDCPNNPSLLTKTKTPTQPDKSCAFFPEQAHCAPDPITHQCPPGFNLNEGEHCFPSGKCPSGFGRVNDDETGSCVPNNNHGPILLCPSDVSPSNAKHCVNKCPRDTHPEHAFCVDNKHHIHKVIHIDIRIHKHISSNSNPNSMVTKDTQLTPQLTVGEAIDGCKDVNSKSSNDLQKSCDIFMASTFNYCQTHQSIANKDHNICSDPLYKFVLIYLKVNNVKLKLFPETIYNITP